VPDLSSGLGALILAADPPASAGDAPAAGGGFVNMIAPFAIIFFIFYFLVIRPQGRERKKRDELLKGLRKHDEVVTTAGLHGTVMSVSDTEVVLRVADDVRLTFDRTAIWQIRNRSASEEAAAAAEPAEAAPARGKGAKEPAKNKERS
jgi:preprotein translocase subunit YajC